MKKCIFCQQEIDAKARACQHCGRIQRGFVATFIMIVGIISLIILIPLMMLFW